MLFFLRRTRFGCLPVGDSGGAEEEKEEEGSAGVVSKWCVVKGISVVVEGCLRMPFSSNNTISCCNTLYKAG